MPIPFTCSCGKTLKAKDELAGKTVRCPACGKPAKIPANGGKADPPSRVAKPPARPPVSAAGTKTAKKAGPAKPPSDDIDLLPETPVRPASSGAQEQEAFTDAQVQSLTAKSKPCPFCGSQIFEGAPVCIDCGTDLKTGKKIVKKKERRPLGPFIKLGVALIVVVGGGLFGWKKYNESKHNAGPGGTPTVVDKTTPAREALRNGNLSDFKTFAKAVAPLSETEVYDVVNSEGLRSEGTPEGRKKAQLAVACLAWYGFATENTVSLMTNALRLAPDEQTKQACLEGLYAAATISLPKRYISTPPMFAGLEKDFEGLKQCSQPMASAVNQITGKADDDSLPPPIRIEAIKLSVVLGQKVILQRFAQVYDQAAPEVKPKVIEALQEMTAQTFKDGAAFNEWWTTGRAIQQSQKEWVAKRLDPANDVADLRAAVKILRMIVDEKVDDKAAAPIEKASDDDVKASAAQWKAWCDANPDKLK